MGHLRDFIEHVAESFQTLFNLDAEPGLTEHENVERVIGHTATAACIISILQPIPVADFFILTPIQGKMAWHIGKVKGFEVTQERARDIVLEVLGILGVSVTAQHVVVSLAKLIPIVGAVLTMPVIYGTTWAIGNVVDYYFECLKADKKPSAQVMKDLFAEQLRVGKAKGQALDKSELERKADELRRKVAERDSDLQHETRLAPRAETRPKPSAFASSPAPPPAADGGRRKIKITLGGGERDAGGRRADERVGGRGKKTIGPDDAPPEDELEDEPVEEPTSDPPPPPPAPGPATKVDEVAARIEVKAMTERTLVEVDAAPKAPGFIDQLERLGKLKQAGVLTSDEFEQAKRKILGL
jgi:uncharacterized protein (DUF697 family)